MAQKSPYQTLKGLKEKTFRLWCSFNEIEDKFGGGFAENYAHFKREMHSQFGDLRYKATWERAWAKLYTELLWAGFDNTSFMIRYFTAAYRDGWDHLLPLMLDEFLKDESALSCVKDGFERIVQMSPDAAFTEEKKLFNAIQEAITRQESTGRRRLPIAS